jgi:hypothetical protein
MSIWKYTDRELAALGSGLHSDGGGLYVKVSKNRKGRSWVLRYTDPKGRERRMGLGRPPQGGVGACNIQLRSDGKSGGL